MLPSGQCSFAGTHLTPRVVKVAAAFGGTEAAHTVSASSDRRRSTVIR